MATHQEAATVHRKKVARHSTQRHDQDPDAAVARNQPADHSAASAEVDDSAFRDFLNGAWGTAVEACRYLPVSLSVLRRETRAGRIKAYRIGGRKLVRYRRSDLDAFLESQAVVVPFASRKRA